MLNKVTDFIKRKLQKFVPEEKRTQSALSYGIDMALYTMISTSGLLFISFAMNSLAQGTIIVFTCYLNQTIGGGYHASTHMRCFFSMTFFLILGVLFCKLNTSTITMGGIGILSCVVLLLYPVVLHPNRAFLRKRLPYLGKRSRGVTLFEMLLVILFSIIHFCHLNAYIIALVLSAVSRIVAKHGQNIRMQGGKKTNSE